MLVQASQNPIPEHGRCATRPAGDIEIAYSVLETDRQSQFLRRCVVRAVFSYMQAIVDCLKIEIYSTIRTGGYSAHLTRHEHETLGPLTINGAQYGVSLPLDQDIKRTFDLASKVWGISYSFSKNGDGFKNFMAAKSAYDRLAHPRAAYNIEVTDYDLHCYTTAGIWVQNEFQRLFDARVDFLATCLPINDRATLLSKTRNSSKGFEA